MSLLLALVQPFLAHLEYMKVVTTGMLHKLVLHNESFFACNVPSKLKRFVIVTTGKCLSRVRGVCVGIIELQCSLFHM